MKSLSLQMKLTLPIALMSIAIFGSMTFVTAQKTYDMTDRSARQYSVETGRSYANHMVIEVESSLTIARTMAHSLESFKKGDHTGRTVVAEALREVLEKNRGLIGTWTGWEPNAWDGKDGSFVNVQGHDNTGRIVPFPNPDLKLPKVSS